MKESILQRPFSILLIKPEFMLLPRGQQQQIWNGLTEITGPNILDRIQTIITRNQAEILWENVRSYPWSGSYYDKMSGACITTIILDGQERAKTAKLELRSRFRPQISVLTSQINAGYEADIFHGSDPGKEKQEAMILGI